MLPAAVIARLNLVVAAAGISQSAWAARAIEKELQRVEGVAARREAK